MITFEPWTKISNEKEFDVIGHDGEVIGYICELTNDSKTVAFDATSRNAPYEMSAQDLRTIADKMDELNGVVKGGDSEQEHC